MPLPTPGAQQRDETDALILRAQNGDVRAFEELLAGHQSQVRRFARAFAQSPADTDDLAQEALVKVYKSLRLFQHQSAFTSWLYAVVRNVFLDALKSRRGREKLREEPLKPENAGALVHEGNLPDDELRRAQEHEQLWRALRQVPPEFRAALVLFDLEGHSYDEVAAIEGVPVGTIKSRLSRGRAHLRKILEEDDAKESALRSRSAPETAHDVQLGTNVSAAPSKGGSR